MGIKKDVNSVQTHQLTMVFLGITVDFEEI